MELFESIKHHFSEHIQVAIECADSLLDILLQASEQLTQCLLAGNKYLICGNAGSVSNAMHFTQCLLNRFEVERPSLPAISLCSDIATLSAIASDEGKGQCFAKQIKALGSAGDTLIMLTTTGNSDSLLNAFDTAISRDMNVIVLSGGDGGELATRLDSNHIDIRVPSKQQALIQQCHLVIIHCLCDIIDKQLFMNEA